MRYNGTIYWSCYIPSLRYTVAKKKTTKENPHLVEMQIYPAFFSQKIIC